VFLFGKNLRKKADVPLVQSPKKAAKTAYDPAMPSSDPAGAPGSTDPVTRKRHRPQTVKKTRLMGLDTSDDRIVDLFGEDKADTETRRMQFPVGMVMVTKGPGFGETFALKAGMSQIGRGEGQAVKLDFGDMAISRENHAAIVYDPMEHNFLLGHGGKSNIVRLNGKPVVSTCELKDGDVIEIGETRMRFIAICSKTFNWETAETGEGSDDNDMEIA
jgi:hypothetical protein